MIAEVGRLGPNVAVPTVLVVDDDDYVRTTIQRMLSAIGVRIVHQAQSAAGALEIAGRPSADIDVIVSDLEMPGVDGMEFLRLLSERRPGAAVLIVSGKDEDILRSVELMARAYGLEVLGVLPKPATIGVLRDALSKYRRTGVAGEAAPSEAVVSADDLAHAIVRREFTLHYQPKVELATRRVSGVEGLARWRHPDRGLLPPAAFIALIEQHGLIDQMTFALFQEGADMVRRWEKAGFRVPLSLNVSQSTLADTSFAARVIDLFADAGLPPSRLVVEVTETVAMTNLAHCLETLVRLRMRGVGLSIDDFGTGHASFQQLSRVPYTELKIDRSFVAGVATQPRLQAIVESSLGIARQLGLTAAAEGVETRSDWECLSRLGCQTVQGYLVAKPMDGEKLPGWARIWETQGIG
jgi:EAL domain-containing protein (putative c-di-GMP-specific phosphodiesterase class I)/AmiR/NasT family two-component response regulator